MRKLLFFVVGLLLLASGAARHVASAQEKPVAAGATQVEVTPVLKIAFVSNREHYWYPHVYLYEHDGVGTGKIVGSIDPRDKRLDHQPVLTEDGRWCVFGSELEGQVGQLQWWDLKDKTSRDLGPVNQSPNAVFSPSLTADGGLLAFSAWRRGGGPPRWDVYLFDLAKKQWIDLPGLNTAKHDERRAAISGDGRWIAYTTNAPDGRGLTDVRLYDRSTNQVVALPEANSAAMDSYPSLSGDGRYLCFASDRDGGAGGLDLLLFDCPERRFVDVPGLNSPGHEQTPSLTRDGRYITFVSERFGGAGEHDVLLYDRSTAKLLNTPGLNTDRDDYDPAVVLLRTP